MKRMFLPISTGTLRRALPAVDCLTRTKTHRAGASIVLIVLVLVAFMVCAAFAVDLAYARLARAELRNAADAAALAAGGVLRDTSDVTSARATAVQFAGLNKAAGSPVVLDPNADVVFGRSVYDPVTHKWSFVAAQEPYDSVKVFARRTTGSPGGPIGMFFARVIGKDTHETAGSAVATFLPRDIALVIDLSGSMLYDSTLKHENVTTINNYDIWTALGSPKFGNMKNWNTLQYLTGSTSSILSTLGLTNVPYPYPQGSWSEFVSYVKTDTRLPSSYKNKYGLKTWVDYLLQYRSYKASTPILSNTPEQPVTALKSAVDIMLEYLATLDTVEHVGLCVFDDTGRIEMNLSEDLPAVNTHMTTMQAGHYGRQTNIGQGIQYATQLLTGPSARPGARKVMIVFTDGIANRPTNETVATQFAIQKAQDAANQDITIHTITFSSEADSATMAQIADIDTACITTCRAITWRNTRPTCRTSC